MISDALWTRRFGRAADVVGRTIGVNGIPFTIAGVTRRGFHGTGQVTDAPAVFVPLAQRGPVVRSDERDDDPNVWWVLMMGRLRPGASAPQAQPALDLLLKRTVAAAKPELAAKERLFARLALLLGGVAVALSAIGLYGLLAYGVAQRIPEIGLRMALGAERSAVRWMVLKQSLRLAAGGLVAGGAGAIAGTRLVESMLYELPARDPATIAAAAAVMLLTCFLAGYLPARRASRVDPLVALRAE